MARVDENTVVKFLGLPCGSPLPADLVSAVAAKVRENRKAEYERCRREAAMLFSSHLADLRRELANAGEAIRRALKAIEEKD